MYFFLVAFLYFLGYFGQNLSLISNLLVVTTICGLSYMSTNIWPEENSGHPSLPWMTYPDIEKTEWINKIIRIIWPLSLHETRRFLQELSHCLTRDYFSPGIKFVINSRALNYPRVVGVKTHEVQERAKIVTDLHLEYESDSLVSIHLLTNWAVAEIKLDISRIYLKAHLRLECELNTMQGSDLLQGIKVSALEFPQTDISFGLLTAVLGVDRVVKHYITQFLESYLMFPKKYELYTNSGKTEVPVIPLGVLNIFVDKAKGLLNKDKLSLSGRSDPYVLVSFSVDCRQHNFQSQTINNSLEAAWKYMCQVPVEDLNTLSSLSFKVRDADLFTVDDHMGSTEIPPQQLEFIEKPLETWKKLYLHGKPAGKLKIMVSFSPCTEKKEERASADPRRQGLLTLFVDSCQNLSKLSNRHPYWRLKSSLGDNVQLSRSVQMTSSPVFCEKFVFIVRDLKREQVKVSVHNVKNNEVGGQLSWEVSSIAQSGRTLSQLTRMELNTKSPAGQKKDPNILLGLEYRQLSHHPHLLSLFPTHSKKKILRISEEKLLKNQISILETSTVGVTRTTVLLELSLHYHAHSSSLRLLVNSISFLNTAEDLVFLQIDLKRGKLQKNLSNTLTVDTRQKGQKVKTNIDKKCEYKMERSGLRHFKLKVNWLVTQTQCDCRVYFSSE